MTAKATRIAADHHVFHVWNEISEYSDSNRLYLDLETAKAHAASDYESEEYGDFDPKIDDPAERPELSWTPEVGGRWCLIDGDNGTGICIDKRAVYRPAAPEEIAEQDRARAERAAIAAREATARRRATTAA